MDWDYWLGRKYALMQQNADADTARAQGFVTTSNAGANLDSVKAGLMPGQAAADIAESRARTNLTSVNAGLAPGLAKASEAASYGAAKANVSQASLFGAQATGENQASDSLSKLGLTANPIIQNLLRRLSGIGLTPAQ